MVSRASCETVVNSAIYYSTHTRLWDVFINLFVCVFIYAPVSKHATVSTKTLPRKPRTPWMTPEIIKAKTLRHNLERTWRGSRTHLDRSRYKHQCHLCNRMMTKAKSKYLADGIAENSDNPRRLWNSINNILHRIPLPALPEFTSVKSLCDHFSGYFVDKIETIRPKISR